MRHRCSNSYSAAKKNKKVGEDLYFSFLKLVQECDETTEHQFKQCEAFFLIFSCSLSIHNPVCGILNTPACFLASMCWSPNSFFRSPSFYSSPAPTCCCPGRPPVYMITYTHSEQTIEIIIMQILQQFISHTHQTWFPQKQLTFLKQHKDAGYASMCDSRLLNDS